MKNNHLSLIRMNIFRFRLQSMINGMKIKINLRPKNNIPKKFRKKIIKLDNKKKILIKETRETNEVSECIFLFSNIII